jgi:hypothetical protein
MLAHTQLRDNQRFLRLAKPGIPSPLQIRGSLCAQLGRRLGSKACECRVCAGWSQGVLEMGGPHHVSDAAGVKPVLRAEVPSLVLLGFQHDEMSRQD